MNLIGKQYGNYRLLSLLGSGGFADVYLGEHIHLGNKAAVKILSSRLSQQDRDAFRDEARLLVKLNHPLIVRLLDFGITIEDGTPYLIMEYAPNGSLRKRHPQGSILPLPVIIAYVQQIGESLQYAHDQRLIHRDIKPANLLLGKSNEVLLSDFGIALQTSNSLNQSLKDIVGTAVYMSPEQIQGRPQPASDQYALGVIVYEWLCGTVPFSGTSLEVMTRQITSAPPALSQKNPQVPPLIEQVVMKTLEKEPQNRFANIRAFVNALRQAAPQGLQAPSWPGIPDMPTIIAPFNLSTWTNAQSHSMPPQTEPQRQRTSDYTRPSAAFVPPASAPTTKPEMYMHPSIQADAQARTAPPFPIAEQGVSTQHDDDAVPRRTLLKGAIVVGTIGVIGTATWVLLNNRQHTPAVTVSPTPTRSTPTSSATKSSVPTITNAQSSNGSMFGLDLQHSRVVPNETKLTIANVSKLQPLWKSYLGGSISISSPTVVAGIIYIGSTNSHLYAVNASDGSIAWAFQTDNEILSSPALAGNGVFFGSNDKHIYGITNKNELSWKFPLSDGVAGSPVISNGTLYLGSSNASFYALDAATGKVQWSKVTGNGIASSPAIFNNRVYFGSYDSYVYSLDVATGGEIWKTKTGAGVFSSPTVVDGVVYVGGQDTYIYALDAESGHILWQVKTNNFINSSPCVWNKMVFVGSKDSNLYALDLSGRVLWKKASPGEFASSPTIANGVLYVGSWDSYLYALNPMNGKELWKYQTSYGIESSPAVVDGRVYVGARNGYLYGFGLA